MAWSDVMPVLSDQMVKTALEESNEEDRAEYEDLFEVDYVLPLKYSYDHSLSFSLFYKHTNAADPDITLPNEDLLRNPAAFGINTRYNPWEHYIQPLLDYGPVVMRHHPNVGIRVYLAADLGFLAERLNEFAEVRVMKGASIRSSPGMMWRLLAIEDSPGKTTMLDADLIKYAAPKLLMTESLHDAGIGFWRVPVPYDYSPNHEKVMYRTMAGCFWGTTETLPMRMLLFAYYWHIKKGSLIKQAAHPRDGVLREMFGADWPNYGSDEFFLTTVLFPRLVAKGALTIMQRPTRSYFLGMDIEYASAASSSSRINYTNFRGIIRGCPAFEPKRNCTSAAA